MQGLTYTRRDLLQIDPRTTNLKPELMKELLARHQLLDDKERRYQGWPMISRACPDVRPGTEADFMPLMTKDRIRRQRRALRKQRLKRFYAGVRYNLFHDYLLLRNLAFCFSRGFYLKTVTVLMSCLCWIAAGYALMQWSFPQSFYHSQVTCDSITQLLWAGTTRELEVATLSGIQALMPENETMFLAQTPVSAWDNTRRTLSGRSSKVPLLPSCLEVSEDMPLLIQVLNTGGSNLPPAKPYDQTNMTGLASQPISESQGTLLQLKNSRKPDEMTLPSRYIQSDTSKTQPCSYYLAADGTASQSKSLNTAERITDTPFERRLRLKTMQLDGTTRPVSLKVLSCPENTSPQELTGMVIKTDVALPSGAAISYGI